MWEQRYAILQPKRTETNFRYYDDRDLRLLLSISMLNERGVKISRIANMSMEEIHEACKGLQEISDEHAHQVNALVLSMIEMDEVRFEKIISNCTIKFGFANTMTKVIYPFYDQVGVLWQTGSIRPAQEHFITNLVRQKLIVAIDAQVAPRDPGRPAFMLFLPENEMHELGLLFASYMLRHANCRVIYLGQSVPEDDLPSVYQSHEPKYLFTILTVTPPKETAATYLNRLAKQFPDATILATGQAIEHGSKVASNIVLMKSSEELMSYVD
jgi:MerR family transcriptional regulator, light-induced transcriptional regulator